MSKIDEEEVWALAHAMADAARVETLALFRGQALGTENKVSDGYDPVTLADRASERAMRSLLEARRPNDGILGEEEGVKEGTSGWTWVLDPIDGTRGFVSGTPTWGVLISLNDETGPKLGVIDQPYIGERFFGGLGQNGFVGPHGKSKLVVRDTTALETATIFTTFPEVGSAVEAKAFRKVASRCNLTRYGMDCYAYALLAAGQIDLVMEAGLQPYDICGPIAVIEAAGGIVTNWSGGPAHHGGRVLAAATPALHAEAMAVIAEFDI